ncbi:sporulation protein [Planococcus shenhongbingii]|uniref:Sporulation protein n=1 Tax=Planococcus shenhongbingii TaxID=3058398 RepID=A0ABT8N866_9BACL|nr:MULTISPECIES: sporulation protein [unclassified Planococcus (in: firmicutes)]MDN7243923.1 sporulation protein [Planococcus sp. N017]WKA57101.1 sporulation protein [Planococcus sp. N016]
MNFKQFLSSIGIGSLKINTVVERPHLEEGETLNGTVYFTGGNSDQEIEYIELNVVKQIENYREDSDFDVIENIVAKQSLEFIGSVKSKDAAMHQFDIVPDERWLLQNSKGKLILRTIVHIVNGVDVQDEDEISYGQEENF